VKEEVIQQESCPPEEHAPAAAVEEAPVEPATAVEQKSAPAAEDPATAFPGERRVSQVEQTCCGGFATKSKICVIQ
jgi:hypothetical protein